MPDPAAGGRYVLTISDAASALIDELAEDIRWLTASGHQVALHGEEAISRLLGPEGQLLLTGGTGDNALVLEAAEALRDAHAAARALKAKLMVVERSHSTNSAVCVATPTVPKPGPDLNDPVRVEAR